MKRSIAPLKSFAFFCLLLLSVNAQAYNNYYSQGYQSRPDPVETIQTALDKLKTFSTNRQNINPVLLRSFIENEIIPHFAFDQMTFWIAGPHANNMDTAELKDLEERVKQTFLKSLASHLGNFDAESTQVRFRAAQYRSATEATVNATVFRNYAPPARLEFRMRAHGNNWKIIDVKANGTSAVIYYRKHFMSSLRPERSNQRSQRPQRQQRNY